MRQKNNYSDSEPEIKEDWIYNKDSCGYKTLDEEHEYVICPICFWEDDYSQFVDVDLAGGANEVSLRQAQQNYLKYGACEVRCLDSVRKPNARDIKDTIL